MANTQENAIQSNGMANYFAQAPLENEKVKDAAIQQILLFNCIVGVSFGVNEEATRTQYIIMQIYNMAKEMGHLCFIPICTCFVQMENY